MSRPADGTSASVIPSSPAVPASRPATTTWSTDEPSTTNRFVPRSTQPAPSGSNTVAIVAGRQPTPCSATASVPVRTPDATAARTGSACSGGAASRTAGTSCDTVGSSGPGAITRPSSSTTTARSTNPSPIPPQRSGIVSAGQSRSSIRFHSALASSPRSTIPRISAIGHSRSSTARTDRAQLVLLGREVQLHSLVSLPRPVRARGGRASPSAVSGSESTTTSCSGSLCRASRSARERRAAPRASGAGCPSRTTTRATPISPITSSGARGDRDIRDRGVGGEHRLDLHGVDVVAAAHVHLLAAADEPEAAGLVEPPEVAGADEAVARERGGRRCGVVPVAGHHRRRAQAHLADLASVDRPVVVVAGLSSTPACGRPTLTSASSSRIVERGADADPGLGARVADGERRRRTRARASRTSAGVAGPPPTTMACTARRGRTCRSRDPGASTRPAWGCRRTLVIRCSASERGARRERATAPSDGSCHHGAASRAASSSARGARTRCRERGAAAAPAVARVDLRDELQLAVAAKPRPSAGPSCPR